MTGKGDYLESALIDWAFADSAFPAPPGTIYVGLHTGDPTDDGSANEVPTSDGYDRAGLANPGDWTITSNNTAANATEARFGPATADWGDISHVTLWDSQTGGNNLYNGGLGSTRTILTDDEARFAAGEITTAED
jgi:hypothetical protein